MIKRDGEVVDLPENTNPCLAWYDDSIFPLVEAGRIDIAIVRVENALERSKHIDDRSFHLTNLVSFLHAAGQYDECLERAQQHTDECPNEPLAWSALAKCYHFADYRPNAEPTDEDIADALRCWRQALNVAYDKNAWVREISFDFCRGLTHWKMWLELEDVMRGILAHLKSPPCRHDTADLHGDWLKNIPPGAISGDILGSYRRALTKRQRMKSAP